MKISFPKTHGEPRYEVEFRPNGYHINGKRVKRVTTVLAKFPDSGEGLLNWSKERVALTARRLLQDRVKVHPKTKNSFCYFPAEQIDLIIDTALRNPDEIKDQTAETGTAVHAFIEEWLNAGATEEARQAIYRNYLLPENPQLLEILQAQTNTSEMSDTDRNLFYDKMKSYAFNKFCMFWLKSGLTYVASEIVVGAEIQIGKTLYSYGGRIDILAMDKKERLILLDFKTSKYISPAMFSQVAAYKLAYERMYGKKIYKCAIIQCPREWTERNMGFGIYKVNTPKYKTIFLFLLRTWNETEFSAADCRKDYLA